MLTLTRGEAEKSAIYSFSAKTIESNQMKTKAERAGGLKTR
jgi:hypothetical protein